MNEERTISKKQLRKYSIFMLFTIAVVGGSFMFTGGNSSITGNVVAIGGPGETVANGQALPTCSQEHGEVLTFNVV